jgi:acetyltransferase
VGDRTVLSELASKKLLARLGIPFAPEQNVFTATAAAKAAQEIGFPVAIKLCGNAIAHKTERGLVRLGIVDSHGAETAAKELLALARPDDGEVSLLVASMIEGDRELIAGLVHDQQFGPTIMLGVGGIYAEAQSDVVFRPLPLRPNDPEAMLGALKLKQVFSQFRGTSAVRLSELQAVLTGLEAAQRNHPEIRSIDINPVIVTGTGHLIAVDALIEINGLAYKDESRPSRSVVINDQNFEALFNPRGVVVVGASSHPGKFGFVSLHNILASGYQGKVFGTNLNGEEVLGVKTVSTMAELPENEIDMAIVCTPANANFHILGECASKNIPTVFVTTAGYREADESGRIAELQLASEANRLGLLMIGPNGQGIVSTPARLCAQIVAPYPPRGNIAVASQSGNFVSGFLNYARQTEIGISRSVSIGNAAQVSVGDVLDFFSRDSETHVSLAYIEGVEDGRRLMSQLSTAALAKPLVIVKGGVTASGARAATSHTGSLASDAAIFDGMCQQIGVSRATTIEEAFDVAATFATQPLPRGPRTVVLTTVGGWGVLTTDAIQRDSLLTLIDLPNDLVDELNMLLPSRWSKRNPIDCAGGETRDTIPEILNRLAAHPSVDAIVFLGIGVQSNQARLIREGRFYSNFGLERIVSYHERQDERFAQAARQASINYDKPVLTATELAVADPNNPGVLAVRQSGRLCYPSGNRAVTALGYLYRYAKFRGVAT